MKLTGTRFRDVTLQVLILSVINREKLMSRLANTEENVTTHLRQRFVLFCCSSPLFSNNKFVSLVDCLLGLTIVSHANLERRQPTVDERIGSLMVLPVVKNP
jgi:hypothetical protein